MKKTKDNTQGLTGKQLLSVEDMAEKAKRGESITPVDTTKKVYNVGSHNSAKTITSRNLHNPDFRAALMDAFHQKNILGANGKVERRLEEGLDAEDKDGNTDYNTILRYIQEINKVAGVYAPQKVEKKTMTLNLDMSEEQLDEHIKQLQKELKDK